MERVLTKEEISLESLNEVLSMVYETTVDKEDSSIFLVEDKITLRLEKERNLIRFSAITTIPHTTSDELAAKVANQLNSEYIIVKTFFLREGTELMAFFFRYDLMYDSGLDTGLLLKSLRRYNDIAMDFIDKIKESGIERN